MVTIINASEVKLAQAVDYSGFSRKELIAETKKRFPKLTAKQIQNNSNENLIFRLTYA